jgi:hypothetical protein
MADLVLVHKDSGEEVLLNRDQILNAEVYDGKTDILLANGSHLFINEGLKVLRDKAAPNAKLKKGRTVVLAKRKKK